jgi:hypothetical protein
LQIVFVIDIKYTLEIPPPSLFGNVAMRFLSERIQENVGEVTTHKRTSKLSLLAGMMMMMMMNLVVNRT